MRLSDFIANIHWIPVILMTLFSFILGALWHTPFLFGKTWKKETNSSNHKIKVPLIFGGTAILHLLALSFFNMFANRFSAKYGLLLGLSVSLFWILPSMASTYLFANRSLKLIAIDAGMYIILFSLSGFVFAIW